MRAVATCECVQLVLNSPGFFSHIGFENLCPAVRLGRHQSHRMPIQPPHRLVETVNSPALGIVLDPGNCVANLELPHDVVERTAAWVNNLHIKDFTFSRQPGWVGFYFSGAPLGEGLLDYSAMSQAADAAGRGLHQIIEHWLPRRGSPEETLRDERMWTQQAIDYLRSKNQ